MLVALYTNSSVRGGAEQVLAILAAELPDTVELAVVGTNQAVVEWIARERPSSTQLVIPRAQNRPGMRSHLVNVFEHGRAFAQLAPDVVHVNMTTALSATAALAALSLPGSPPYVVVEHLPGELGKRLLLAKRLLCHRAAAHATVAATSARFIEHQLGPHAREVQVVPNGVDIVASTAKDHEFPTVGIAGRLEPHKGVDLLVAAMPRMPSVRLLVAGEGSMRSALEQQARDLGVHDRVSFVGWLDGVEDFLGHLDAFVLPSRQEALPLVLMEAMQAGVPVIASDVGAVGELVRHGHTGLLVPPNSVADIADAVQLLVRDDALRERLARNGQDHSLRHYSKGAMVQRYLRLYGQVGR